VPELWVPKCPQCGDNKIILAPETKAPTFRSTQYAMEVKTACSQCTWRGTVADVPYTRL